MGAIESAAREKPSRRSPMESAEKGWDMMTLHC